MDIRESTERFEAWLESELRGAVVARDLKKKHRKMREESVPLPASDLLPVGRDDSRSLPGIQRRTAGARGRRYPHREFRDMAGRGRPARLGRQRFRRGGGDALRARPRPARGERRPRPEGRHQGHRPLRTDSRGLQKRAAASQADRAGTGFPVAPQAARGGQGPAKKILEEIRSLLEAARISPSQLCPIDRRRPARPDGAGVELLATARGKRQPRAATLGRIRSLAWGSGGAGSQSDGALGVDDRARQRPNAARRGNRYRHLPRTGPMVPRE